ncbi:MAG: aldo/keto reductase, partial [Verrucomicrobiota bacterium]
VASGAAFPSVGLGTWKIPHETLPSLIPLALEIGYRHLDCACDYGNEEAVGAGLKAGLEKGICSRDDVWVTSKLWNTFHEPKHVRAACERSLKDLQLDELDLYLVHFPIAQEYVSPDVRYPPGWFFDDAKPEQGMKLIDVPYAETWAAMEELKKAGLVKEIGVCNLNISLLRDLLTTCSIRPAVHQVEMHPYLTQPRLVRYCEAEKIRITAFSPFGASSYVPLNMAKAEESLFDDQVMQTIADRQGRTIGQVALRWGVQRGTVVIPKTQTEAHLRENFSIFDFELSEDDMQQIEALNQHRRFNDPGEFCEAAFNTFYPIFD